MPRACKDCGSCMQTTPLTAVVLTYNSARTLHAVLEALSWCEDVLVVDSGSTDGTLAIARSHNARVLEKEFHGFGEQKNFAVTSALFDWVFVVDSDEIVSEALRDEIQSHFKHGHGDVSGYLVPIKLVFLGGRMRFSGNTIKYALRIFNRQNGNFNLALVHELVELQGRQVRLSRSLWHYSYLTLDDYFQKFNRYTTLAAQELYNMRKRPPAFKVWAGLPIYFFKMYVIKLGFLDGYRGFLWCLFSALYPVVKYAKLKEMTRTEKTNAIRNLKCSP
jgi:glycosyltransferase involved in cell wall biosynthesis